MIVNYLFEASKFFCSLQKSLLRQRSFVVTGPGDQLQHRSTPWCPNQISLLKTSKNFLLIIFEISIIYKVMNLMRRILKMK